MSPVTKAGTTDKKAGAAAPGAFTAIGKLRQVPLGALLGLTVAGVFRFARPDLSPDGWMEAPFAIFCAGCGILLERSAHYAIGWLVDARLRHLAAAYEARVEMNKLRRYEKEGVFSQLEARRIAARIAKRDVAGGPGPKRIARGSYQKKPPKPASPESSPPGPVSPDGPTT